MGFLLIVKFLFGAPCVPAAESCLRRAYHQLHALPEASTGRPRKIASIPADTVVVPRRARRAAVARRASRAPRASGAGWFGLGLAGFS